MPMLELLTLASILCLVSALWLFLRLFAKMVLASLLIAACCQMEIGNEKETNVETVFPENVEERQQAP